MEKGCDPNYSATTQARTTNLTPVFLAIYYRSKGTQLSKCVHRIQSLLEFLEKLVIVDGLDLNVKNSEGKNALHLAVGTSSSDYDMIRMLVNAGADLEARDYKNNTAACRAALNENKDPPIKVDMTF